MQSYTEKLFSYGTLRYESVQLATFGRKLAGSQATLPGFKLSLIEITDADVIATSGETHHPIITPTGDQNDEISGFVFDVSKEELEQADAYEVDDYKRILIKLSSGVSAWVYIDAKVVLA